MCEYETVNISSAIAENLEKKKKKRWKGIIIT